MRKEPILITVCLVFLACVFSYAGECEPPSGEPADQRQSGLVLPETLENYTQTVQSEVDKRNDIETSDQVDQGIEKISYNEDGSINMVSYDDGAILKYNYGYDDSGEINKCVLHTTALSIDIHRSTSGAVEIEIYLPDPDESPSSGPALGPGPAPAPDKTAVPAVVLNYQQGEIDIEELSRTPMKFDCKEIAKAITKTTELKRDALKEYEDSTVIYYQKIEEGLNNISNAAVEKENDLEFLKALDRKDMPVAERRSVIDGAVKYMRSKAERTGADEKTAKFLINESEMRKAILMPAREMCEGKVEAALEYINGVIDKLLKSRLALYLKADKDKIDAIIKLPEKAQDTPQE